MGTYLHMFPAQQGIRKYIPTKNYKYAYIIIGVYCYVHFIIGTLVLVVTLFCTNVKN